MLFSCFFFFDESDEIVEHSKCLCATRDSLREVFIFSGEGESMSVCPKTHPPHIHFYNITPSFTCICGLVITRSTATFCSNRRKYPMSSCTTSIDGKGGGRRLSTVVVYILVVLGFMINVRFIQHFSTVRVPSPASATTVAHLKHLYQYSGSIFNQK